MNKRVRKCIHKDKDPKCADCPDVWKYIIDLQDFIF